MNRSNGGLASAFVQPVFGAHLLLGETFCSPRRYQRSTHDLQTV